MSLHRLAIRAKNSISGLLSFGDGQSSSVNLPNKRSQPAQENILPEYTAYTSQTLPTGSCRIDVTTSSSKTKDSPSRRVKLKESLRRIGSLRSIRSSPCKTVKRDKTPSPVEEIRTPPTERSSIKPSLMLDFQQSPASQPMFEMPPRRRSNSSSMFVHQSSPVAIPNSTKPEISSHTPARSSILPSGTLPDSPAPIQAALALDATIIPPSPVSSPLLEGKLMADPLPTPMPGTHLTFEELRPSFGLPASSAKVSQKRSGYFGTLLNEGQEELYHSSYVDLDHEAAHVASTKALQEFIAICNDTIFPDHPSNDQRTRRYRRANGEHVPHASDEEALINKSDHMAWGDDSDMVAAAVGMTTATTRATLSSSSIGEDMAKHASTWSHHVGLYDGSGYGDEIASIAPSMSTEERFKAPQATAWLPHETPSGQTCVASIAESRGASDDGSNLEEFIHAYSGYEGDDAAGDGNHA